MRALPARVTAALSRQGAGLTVLVVRLGALGDVLRTLPAVRRLRARLPAARIHWAVDDRFAIAVDGLAEIDGRVLFPRRTAGAAPVLAFLRALRATRPDLAIDFHGHLRSGLVGLLSGARVRVGPGGVQQKEGNRWLTTHRVDCGPRRVSRVERALALLDWLGPGAEPAPAELPLARLGRAAAAAIVQRTVGAGRPYAIVAPGASAAQAYKKPPAALLAAACEELARLGIAPLIVWGPGEEPDARDVAAAAPRGIVAPPTDLRELAGLLAGARLFAGGDSGPLHLACAAGCPVLGLYGPTDPEINRPWGVPHRALAPAGRHYTGIKRRDRRLGFSGLEAAEVRRAVADLAAASGPATTADPGSAVHRQT